MLHREKWRVEPLGECLQQKLTNKQRVRERNRLTHEQRERDLRAVVHALCADDMANEESSSWQRPVAIHQQTVLGIEKGKNGSVTKAKCRRAGSATAGERCGSGTTRTALTSST
eukprot:3975733-Amphidinium_carterae.1